MSRNIFVRYPCFYSGTDELLDLLCDYKYLKKQIVHSLASMHIPMLNELYTKHPEVHNVRYSVNYEAICQDVLLITIEMAFVESVTGRHELLTLDILSRHLPGFEEDLKLVLTVYENVMESIVVKHIEYLIEFYKNLNTEPVFGGG